MPNTIKVLGQSFPVAATATALYPVPNNTSTVVSSIVVCNQSAVATSFTIAVRVAGAGDGSKDKLYYQTAILGNATFVATIGITLNSTDVIYVTATLGTLSFNLFGQENT